MYSRTDGAFSRVKTVAEWLKPHGLDGRTLFMSLGEALGSHSMKGWATQAKAAEKNMSVYDMLHDPGRLCFLLLWRALTAALFDMIMEVEHLLTRRGPEDWKKLLDSLDFSFEDLQLEIGPAVIVNPRGIDFLHALQVPLREWLLALGLGEPGLSSFLNRFYPYFEAELDRRWMLNKGELNAIGNVAACAFTEKGTQARSWLHQAFQLERRVHGPVMEFEPYDLTLIHIPLRAYYEEDCPDQPRGRGPSVRLRTERRRRVVLLDRELGTWLQDNRPGDGLRVIAGRLGCGRTTSALMFAVEEVRRGRARVLTAPLSRFDSLDDLSGIIGRCAVEDAMFPDDPFREDDQGPPLLLILELLEDMGKVGQASAIATLEFCRSVLDFLKKVEARGVRLKVLVTGWEPLARVLEDEILTRGQVLHLVPFYVPPARRGGFFDPENLLEVDQRDQWRRRYVAASGFAPARLEEIFKNESFTSLTADPIDAYLTAKCLERGKLAVTEKTSEYDLAEDFIKNAYERTFDDRRPYRWLFFMDQDSFVRALEEVAVAVWHGRRGALGLELIAERFQRNGLAGVLGSFTEQAASGVTGLVSARLVDSAERRGSPGVFFSFVHQAFWKYLAVKRIIGELRGLAEDLERKKASSYSGVDESEALARWFDLCGPAVLDRSLFSFFRDQVRFEDKGEVSTWQKMVCRLIGRVLRDGAPRPRGPFFLNGQALRRWELNGEKVLLAAHYVCALVTESQGTVEWPGKTAAGEWFRRLQGQRACYLNNIVLECLGFLNLSDCALQGMDLWGAKLRRVDLRRASLDFACLVQADLVDADLSGAVLRHVNLREANLGRVTAVGATMTGSDLRRAVLKEANLTRVDLSGSDLTQASLTAADLRFAGLRRADLTNADLRWADLAGADFFEADLGAVDVFEGGAQGADLSEANLDDADFQGANLMGADFKNTDLRQVKNLSPGQKAQARNVNPD
ncbi:MAG: pentapeptide repeat-containing protein [Pseudomonadota bacterium]